MAGKSKNGKEPTLKEMINRRVSYPGRAINTFGAKITGRGQYATDPNKYLTEEELADYSPRPKKKKR